jgi:molybdopterin-guanine dinucleotide biosynthesis protein A
VPDQKPEITGIVLAGGQARRMGGIDKGLLPYRGHPLAYYALNAIKTITGTLLISANRNQARYAAFGYPVVSDCTPDFSGPLAGLLAAMKSADTPYVLAIPCDCPFVSAELLTRLRDAPRDIEIVTLHDGLRTHPVFMRVNRNLTGSLENYLAQGQHKVIAWIEQHRHQIVDCSDLADSLRNINTPQDLERVNTDAD